MSISVDSGKIQHPDAAQERVQDLDFAATLRRLEEIVRLLEGGSLSLEESLAKFEEGIRLARALEAILDRAEQRVQEILNTSGGFSADSPEAGPGCPKEST